MNRSVVHRNRRLVLPGPVLVALTGMIAGFLAGVPRPVPPVLAYACQAANAPCAGYTRYRTAAVDVVHVMAVPTPGADPQAVEPDDGEDWHITAYWNTAVVPCAQTTESAYATVSWTGTGWAVSNVTTSANITAISVCNTDAICDNVVDHAYGYRLIAQVYDPHIPTGDNLRQVEFTTTTVDDGYRLDTDTCTLGTEVSPTSETFSDTDTGPRECGFTCAATGASVAITYQ